MRLPGSIRLMLMEMLLMNELILKPQAVPWERGECQPRRCWLFS
jgi:hypothetical protein